MMGEARVTQGAGRYAPSPSGDLHLGNLRTAMLAWLFARTTNRSFFVRIEDIDRQRDAGAAAQQLDDLRELGIDWDGEPVVQTSRALDHEHAIQRLSKEGLVYECFCTRREIHEAASAPHHPPGVYPGTCRDLTVSEQASARERIWPRKPSLRLRVPERFLLPGAMQFDDVMLGRVTGLVDDIVLRRGDGAVAYNLAVVVDDAMMGVDQVVRGDDLAPLTARQLVLMELLGYPTPQYAHVPLVLGPTGARLAKRDGAVTMAQLRQTGVTADEVRSLLAYSLGLAAAGEEVTMRVLVSRFEVERLPRQPWIWTGTAGSKPAEERTFTSSAPE